MNRFVIVVILAAAFCHGAAKDSVNLEQVVQLALARPSLEASDVTVAQNRVLWLEALSRRRIEITPQMALLTLANPVSLTASLGAGLILRPASVSRLLVLDAHIDLVGAEIAMEQRRFQREMEATEKYTTLELQQRVANEVCRGVVEARDRRDQAQEELDLARATRLDLVRHEQTVLDRQTDCRRMDQEVQLAAVHLGAMLGIDSEDLRIAGIRRDSDVKLTLQPAQTLYKLALAYRPNTIMENKIAALRTQLAAVHETKTRIVLKDNGQFEAEKLLVAEKIQRLERHAEELALQIQTRIAEIRVRMDSLRDELKFASQRLALSAELQQITSVRLRAGLASRAEMAEADEVHRRADLEVARLQHQDTVTLAALIEACGLSEQPPSLRALVYSRTVLEASLP